MKKNKKRKKIINIQYKILTYFYFFVNYHMLIAIRTYNDILCLFISDNRAEFAYHFITILTVY